MKSIRVIGKIIGIVTLLLFLSSVEAETIHVAVAANFTSTIKTIVARFENSTGHKAVVVLGSTGKHYAQIKHGAGYDVFLAADVKRPLLLEQEKVAVPGSRFTYAIGKIALWSRDENFVDKGGKVLASGKFSHLAIANPKLAPYGKAAQQVLESLGLWQTSKNKLVRGENVSQAFQFVMSGNAELGFVAMSQIKQLQPEQQGSYWLVPPSLYKPIEQQAVLLIDSPAARSFMRFLQADVARAIIRQSGYEVPQISGEMPSLNNNR